MILNDEDTWSAKTETRIDFIEFLSAWIKICLPSFVFRMFFITRYSFVVAKKNSHFVEANIDSSPLKKLDTCMHLLLLLHCQ